MVIKETRSDKIFNFINYFLLACVFLICLYPLWFIIIASISNPDLVNGGQVWPGAVQQSMGHGHSGRHQHDEHHHQPDLF